VESYLNDLDKSPKVNSGSKIPNQTTFKTPQQKNYWDSVLCCLVLV